MADYTRKDLHLTSTGVGHRYQPGYYFPSSNFRSVLRDLVPPELGKPDEILGCDHYKTTNSAFHDNKFRGIEYGNDHPTYKKAPAHYKVDYNKLVIEKLGQGSFRKPLTMGNEESEMKAKHKTNKPEAVYLYDRFPAPTAQGILVGDHHKNGPTKLGEQNTYNSKMAGAPYKVGDLSVVQLNDPYLTTTGKNHRRFNPNELSCLKDKTIKFYPTERPPMRDTMKFKSPTKVGRLPNSMIPVPHSGLKTEYKDGYQIPGECCKMTPVSFDSLLPDPCSRTVYTAPHTYKTEYTNIGNEQIVTV